MIIIFHLPNVVNKSSKFLLCGPIATCNETFDVLIAPRVKIHVFWKNHCHRTLNIISNDFPITGKSSRSIELNGNLFTNHIIGIGIGIN